MLKIFSHFLACHFIWIVVTYIIQNLLSLTRAHLLIFVLSACTNDVLFRKSFPMPMSLRVFPSFSSVKFSASWLLLRSLIHLELSFLQIQIHFQYSIYNHPVCPIPFVNGCCLFSNVYLWLLCEKPVIFRYLTESESSVQSFDQCVCFWYYYGLINIALCYNEIWFNTIPSSSFIIQDCLSYPTYFSFHMKLKIVIPWSVKNFLGFLWRLHLICRLLLVG